MISNMTRWGEAFNDGNDNYSLETLVLEKELITYFGMDSEHIYFFKNEWAHFYQFYKQWYLDKIKNNYY